MVPVVRGWLPSISIWVQAYWMLDELLIAGELQEPSKKVTAQQQAHGAAVVLPAGLLPL